MDKIFRLAILTALVLLGSNASAAVLVGEVLDVMVILDPDQPLWAKGIALASLTLNLYTAGLAPNAGGMLRAMNQTPPPI